MRYLHFIIENKEGKQIETVYSINVKPKMSLMFFAKSKKYTYKIWDRETNEITIVN